MEEHAKTSEQAALRSEGLLSSSRAQQGCGDWKGSPRDNRPMFKL